MKQRAGFLNGIVAAFAFALALASCGGGVGSGGTGIVVGGGGGVGSGGTGISIGPIAGLGSIFVNGVDYDIDGATVVLDDAPSLQLGMTVEVSGSVNADFSTGTATRVVSAADMRGPIAAISVATGVIDVLGSSVSTDAATVYAGVAGLSALTVGDSVQIHGMLDVPGAIRATRIEKLAAAAPPVVSGTLVSLELPNSTFMLGTLKVNYSGSSFAGGLSVTQLADGLQVRVRATAAPIGGVLSATQIQPWYAPPLPDSTAASLSAPVTDYTSLAAFKVLGVPVNAAGAQITGGPASSIGNGVTVEVGGAMNNGTLVATKLKIKHVPGTGGPVSFNLQGTIGAFVSSADFRVRGNLVDASGPGVVFTGGTAANLGNGVKVSIVGSTVSNGVLIADSVTFIP